MAEFTRTVQERLRDSLAAAVPGHEWRVESELGGTPVDVVGRPGDDGEGPLVAVELEMRRADPADNTVTLLRALDGGLADRAGGVVVCQVFSGYYDLVRGGVSTKRENAEFVGALADEAQSGVAYHALDLGFEPPKHGAEAGEGWEAAVDAVAGRMAGLLG